MCCQAKFVVIFLSALHIDGKISSGVLRTRGDEPWFANWLYMFPACAGMTAKSAMKLSLLIQPDTAPDGEFGYSVFCPELDIASQGTTEDEARANLQEALELFLEDATQEEIERRLSQGARVTQLELAT